MVSYKDLLNVYWKNIDPFDASGQFCDKGKSYRSVIFFENNSQKELIDQSFKEIEKKFDKKIVTLVWKFDTFYPAENYHQDYYEKNFIRYLMYKNACKKRRNIKKDMELKKIFITLVFILSFNTLNAEMIKPSKDLSAFDVVKIQLEAIKKK